jgi:hypothetical protein
MEMLYESQGEYVSAAARAQSGPSVKSTSTTFAPGERMLAKKFALRPALEHSSTLGSPSGWQGNPTLVSVHVRIVPVQGDEVGMGEGVAAAGRVAAGVPAGVLEPDKFGCGTGVTTAKSIVMVAHTPS